MDNRQAAIEAILDRYERPAHRGLARDIAARMGRAENPACGDVVEAQVRVAGGIVEAARFDGRGCTISQALADAACEALEGLAVGQARRVSLGEVIRVAGSGVAASRPLCASVGLAALQAALTQAEVATRDPPRHQAADG